MSGLQFFDRTFGDVRISRVHETYLSEAAQSWFPGFEAHSFAEHLDWLAPDFCNRETGEIIMPVASWILRYDDTVILIDSCIGNHKDRCGIPGLHGLDNPYLDRLRAAGVEPEEVDYVLCTHLHVDHVGWHTRLENGRWVPTFPNARYVMSRDDHDAALHMARTDSPGRQFHQNIYDDSILPVVEAGLAQLVDGTQDIGAKLLVRPAPGHSAGHVRFELRTGGKIGVFSGDIVHSPVQIPLWHWSSKVCDDPVRSAQTRRELLEFCVEHDALMLPTHFDGPHVCKVRHDRDRFMPLFRDI